MPAIAAAMSIRQTAIVCAVTPHGETGAVLRALSEDHGLVAGYVAGGRGRMLRPVLIPGNRVAIELAARGGSTLPSARVELVASRAPWLGEPLPAAAIGWITAFAATVLPQGHPYPALYRAMDATLDAIGLAPSARGWARALAGFEALVLREVGYGTAPAPPADESWDMLMARLDRQGRAIAARLLGAQAQARILPARAQLIARLRRIAD